MGSTPDAPTKRDRALTVRVVIMTLAAVLLVWFVAGNTQDVQVRFWVTDTHTSLIVVILVSAALGAIIALLLSRGRRRR